MIEAFKSKTRLLRVSFLIYAEIWYPKSLFPSPLVGQLGGCQNFHIVILDGHVRGEGVLSLQYPYMNYKFQNIMIIIYYVANIYRTKKDYQKAL